MATLYHDKSNVPGKHFGFGLSGQNARVLLKRYFANLGISTRLLAIFPGIMHATERGLETQTREAEEKKEEDFLILF